MKAGERWNYTQWEIDEFRKCHDDILYFCEKYVKIIDLDKGIIPYKPYKFQKKMIRTFQKNRFVVCKTGRQVGKALPLTERILTSKGFINFGDLKIGDEVYGKDGKLTKVNFITPVMYNHDCFEIEFDDGTKITADGEHLWEVGSSKWKKTRVLNTNEIIEKLETLHRNKQSLFVEKNECLNFPERKLPIDPYILGVWLGDGTSKNNTITTHIKDLEHWKKEFSYELLSIYEDKRNSNVLTLKFDIQIPDIFKNNKHISNDYLFNSRENRIALLQGLMDTDGYTQSNGVCEIIQKKENLIDQIRFLLNSLGVKTRKKIKLINGIEYYKLTFFSPDFPIYRLERKKIRQKSAKRLETKRLFIKSIKKISSVPVQCITVDNKDHLFLIGETLVPTHNTVTVVAFLLHYLIFNPNVKVAMLAHRLETSQANFERLRMAYELLPPFLQQGVTDGGWNKRSIHLGNNSYAKADATSASSIRGESFNIIFLDEFAHVENNLANEFIESAFPTISSGKTTKILIVSTPKGMNHFYDIWDRAIKKKNKFIPFETHWSNVPGRDKKWHDNEISNMTEEKFRQEHEAEFIGSSNTLLSPQTLQRMNDGISAPIYTDADFRIFEEPKAGHEYCICVDPSRGQGLDDHAFNIIDVTNFPYKQVGVFQNNTIGVTILPNIINTAALKYNEASVLVEINDIGGQVADMLVDDLDYENVIRISSKPGVGQTIGLGVGSKVQRGIKTSPATKRVGCADLKAIIENRKLEIYDEETYKQFLTFVADTQSFAAEEGKKDDIVMSLVIFGWLVHQKYFRDEGRDIRDEIEKTNEEYLDSQLVPFGIFDDGIYNTVDEPINMAYGNW